MTYVGNYVRAYGPNWLSQFGLYRYENASNTKPSRNIASGIYGMIGMVLILFFVLFIIIRDSNNVEDSKVIETIDYENINETYKYDEFDRSNEASETIEEYREEQPKVLSESSAEKQKRSNRKPTEVNKEKLVFLPSRTLQPPKMELRGQTRRRDSIDTNYLYPRPFVSSLPKPRPFHKAKSNTTKPKLFKAESIQDILKYTPTLQNQKIHFSGVYRHPRKNGNVLDFLNNSTNLETQRKLIPQPNVPMSFMPDPLYNFKPHSPSDINLMAVKQFRFAPTDEVTPIISTRSPRYIHNNQQPYNSEAEQVYQEIITTNNNRLNGAYDEDISRMSRRKQKPFQLMLDVYPMHEDEGNSDASSFVPHRARPLRKPSRYPFRPTPGSANANAINNLQFQGQMENNYFRSMAFPQLQQPARIKYPMDNKYLQHAYSNSMNYMHELNRNSKNSEYYYNQPSPSDNQPSKLVVHLNLYPKKKGPNNRASLEEFSALKSVDKRSSIEFEPINEVVNLNITVPTIDVINTTERKSIAEDEQLGNRENLHELLIKLPSDPQ